MAGLDTYTKLLLHCNGTDASTTFTDSSFSGKTVTANGNAQIDTAQSVFGGASGLFDGTGDYLSLADSADWNFGTGDFTIDFRVRFAGLPTSTNRVFLYNQRIDGGNFVSIALYNNTGTYQLEFQSYSSSVEIVNVVKNVTVTTDTWYHIEIVRNGNNFLEFLDGTQQGTTVVASGSLPDLATNLDIARWSGDGSYLNGWLDEIRVSKGIARHTANFTPPTGEYSPLGGSLFYAQI